MFRNEQKKKQLFFANSRPAQLIYTKQNESKKKTKNSDGQLYTLGGEQNKKKTK